MQYNDNFYSLEVIPNLLHRTDPLTKNYFMEVIYWITDQLPQDGFLDISYLRLIMVVKSTLTKRYTKSFVGVRNSSYQLHSVGWPKCNIPEFF